MGCITFAADMTFDIYEVSSKYCDVSVLWFNSNKWNITYRPWPPSFLLFSFRTTTALWCTAAQWTTPSWSVLSPFSTASPSGSSSWYSASPPPHRERPSSPTSSGWHRSVCWAHLGRFLQRFLRRGGCCRVHCAHSTAWKEKIAWSHGERGGRSCKKGNYRLNQEMWREGEKVTAVLWWLAYTRT